MEFRGIDKDMLFMKALKEQLYSEGVELTVIEAPFYNYGISVTLDFSKRDREKDKQFSEMQSHIDCLKDELREVQSCSDKLKQELKMKQTLPSAPIDVASMLINATETVKINSIQRALNPNMPVEYEIEKYSKRDLWQIAEHLLVYCNNNEDED